MTEQTLVRACAGDEEAFRELTDPYRRELQLHIYRIVGSTQDSEDLLQETLLAAWRGLAQFQARASVRAWLYRIATNRSLDALRASRRRPEDHGVTRTRSETCRPPTVPVTWTDTPPASSRMLTSADGMASSQACPRDACRASRRRPVRESRAAPDVSRACSRGWPHG